MRNRLPLIFLSFCCLASFIAAKEATAQPARQRGRCTEQTQARHRAHMVLKSCLEEWKKDKSGSPEPTDDCSAKLSSFMQAAKLARECRATKAG